MNISPDHVREPFRICAKVKHRIEQNCEKFKSTRGYITNDQINSLETSSLTVLQKRISVLNVCLAALIKNIFHSVILSLFITTSAKFTYSCHFLAWTILTVYRVFQNYLSQAMSFQQLSSVILNVHQKVLKQINNIFSVYQPYDRSVQIDLIVEVKSLLGGEQSPRGLKEYSCVIFQAI